MAEELFVRTEVPKSMARLRGVVQIKIGIDVSDVLGLDPKAQGNVLAGLSAVQPGNNLVENNLALFGAAESLDLMQNKGVFERYALGRNAFNPYQIVPQRVTNTFKLTKIKLKDLTKAEQVFNFMPNNLLHQQLPFIVQITDLGEPSRPETRVTHYCRGCWFVDSNMRFDVSSKDDQRLIQSGTIKCTTIQTFDNSAGGSAAAQAISGVASTPGVKSLIRNQKLF